MAMTQKLQTLLNVGLYHTKKGFDAYPYKEWMSFRYVCDRILEVKEDWEVKNLLDKLTHDGYIDTKIVGFPFLVQFKNIHNLSTLIMF
ncbi:hypothetical protein GOQ04_23720 [Emticicia sp. ODNR4P]|nr:hypothetical protein [Emticicia sp. ODNR4P]